MIHLGSSPHRVPVEPAASVYRVCVCGVECVILLKRIGGGETTPTMKDRAGAYLSGGSKRDWRMQGRNPSAGESPPLFQNLTTFPKPQSCFEERDLVQCGVSTTSTFEFYACHVAHG